MATRRLKSEEVYLRAYQDIDEVRVALERLALSERLRGHTPTI